jgi:DNA processing protein
MNENNIIDWLRLIRSENIGTKTFHNLVDIYGNPTKALDAIPELAKKGGRAKNINICSKESAIKELEQIEKYGAKLVCEFDHNYPALLKHIDDAPPALTIKGNLSCLQKKSVAIVGSRNSSLNGNRFAGLIASELANGGYVITSGLARGIDGSAHIASLKSGTIAVVAGGIDVIYPPEHTKLYHDITENGVIIAELPFGTSPKAQNFPQRNRIISGLSYACIVIEASMRSGSLITAKMALSHNRELFAVPGFPMDARYQGTNWLIQQGAHIVTTPKDVLQSINSLLDIKQTAFLEEQKQIFTTNNNLPGEQDLSEARNILLNCLGSSPISIENIIEDFHLPSKSVMVAILELEIAGRIERLSGNRINMIYNQDDELACKN